MPKHGKWRKLLEIVGFIWLAANAWAGEGTVIKVLPQFLDSKGRSALSPSLYERDAYQFALRKEPSKQAGLRLAVQWKAKKVDWTKLKIRAELRGLANDTIHTVIIEEPAKKPRLFGNWEDLKLDGEAFHAFGQLVAWRVSLWEGDHQLGDLESFLWNGVTAH
ncbi:MAG TPA: hypothetical protein VH595_07895 [Verrucomicrobiae bacterium]|jgi:hypothetical protein|nr:hypothetical protein [Verrucomicrobiae bacterium]